MKFSFEHENYRKKLSEDLKQEIQTDGFESARKMLDSAKTMPEYKIAKVIKSAKHEGLQETDDKNNLEFEDRMKSYGFDTIDISSEIPKEINLFIDIEKLSSHGKNLGKKSEVLENFVEMQNSKYYAEFLDKITDGKYTDIRNSNHVVGAYNVTGGVGDMAQIHRRINTKEERHSFLTSKIGGEKMSTEKELWLNFGENTWFTPTKQLVIFSLVNPNFRRFLIMNFWSNYNKRSANKISIYKPIFEEGKDINTLEEFEKYIPEDVLKETNEKIENFKKVGTNGEVYYEIESGNMDFDAKIVLPLMVLKNLPIKPSHPNGDYAAKIGGVYFNIDGFSTVATGREKAFFIDNPNIKKDFSFASIADTIVDLAEKKVYKYNPSNNVD